MKTVARPMGPIRGGRAEMRWTRDPVALAGLMGSNPIPGAK